MPPRREVQRRRLHEDVADLLLEDIRRGLYAVGEALPSERALMDEFGVGRPAVRESLAKLARMGIIEIRPGLRARIRPVTMAPLLQEMGGAVAMAMLTPDGQKHMQQIRLLFEAAVARSIAFGLTDEQLKRIGRVHEQSAAALDDAAAFADMDVLFHRALGEATGNPLITGIYDALGSWLLRQRLANFANPDRPRAAHAAHGRILEALARRDPDAAEQALRDHLSDANRHYWTVAGAD